MKRMPRQKRHRSPQAIGTPADLLRAVERRFGPIAVDLAANLENRVVPVHLGPGSALAENALAPTVLWHQFTGNLWLNPPFDPIEPWAEKSASEADRGASVLLLVPYAVADWFRFHVHHKALVLGLSPRPRFVGYDGPYPKDVQLCVFGPRVAPGFDVWRWKP